MKTALEVLGEMSGISRDTMTTLLEQVQANHARLNGCPRHDFEPIAPLALVGQKYRCTHCGGEVDSHAWYWHQRGRRE